MNEIARGILVAAALQGVPQIYGQAARGRGRCALGVLAEACNELRTGEDVIGNKTSWIEDHQWMAHRFDFAARATCIYCCYGLFNVLASEEDVIAHMNDDHKCDFLEIARKL